MRGEALRVLLIIDGAAVLLEGADEAVVVLEHLAIEAEQVVVFVAGYF